MFFGVDSAQWGFHPGGWGKPPLDEYNRPLYGDVFGVLPKANDQNVSWPLQTFSRALTCGVCQLGEPVDKELWGELQPEEGASSMGLHAQRADVGAEEEEESEEESEDEEAAEAAPADGLQTPSGMATPSGLASIVSTVPGGLETPDFLELRKNAGRAGDGAEAGPRALYQVVPERQTAVRGLMGSERGYDVGAAAGVPVLGEERGAKVRARGVRRVGVG